MEPDSLKHLESKSEWTIQQYEKFKQSLTTSPGFLRLSYQQKKQAITHAAAKYPIIGATKQDIINDLKIGSMFDTKGNMTQFGFKNWAEVTTIKSNNLIKQLNKRLQPIKNNPLYLSGIEKSKRNTSRFGSSVGPSQQELGIINQAVQLEHQISTLQSVITYCSNIINRPESVSSVGDGFIKGIVSGRKVPFVSGLTELNDSINLLTAVQKKQKGLKLSPGENLIIDSFTQLEQLNNQFNLGTSYNVGVGTAGAINFIIELAATGGVTSIIRASAQKGTQKLIQTSLIQSLKQGVKKEVLAIAEKQVMKKITSTVAGKMLVKVGTKTIEYTSKQLIEKTIIALGLTGIRPDMIANNVVPRMLDHFTPVFNEAGEITSLTLTKSGEPFSLALIKGFTLTFTEFFTEQVGSDILAVLGKVKGFGIEYFIQLAGKYDFGLKFLDAIGKNKELLAQFGKRIASKSATKMWTQLTPGSSKEFIKQTLMWDNPFGEYFEEFLSNRIQHYMDGTGLQISTREERETFLVCLITGQAVKIGGKSVGVYQAVSTSKEIKDKQQFKQKQENKQTDSKEKSVTSQTRKEISSQELQRLFDEGNLKERMLIKELYIEFKAGKISKEQYTEKLKAHRDMYPSYSDILYAKKIETIRKYSYPITESRILGYISKLGNDIQGGGSNAKGVHTIQGTNLVAVIKSEGSYEYELPQKSLIEKLNLNSVVKVIDVFVHEGKTYKIMEISPGTQLDKLTGEQIAQIPQSHYDKLLYDTKLIEDGGLEIDPSKSSNFFYDSQTGFHFIDLGVNDNDWSMFDHGIGNFNAKGILDNNKLKSALNKFKEEQSLTTEIKDKKGEIVYLSISPEQVRQNAAETDDTKRLENIAQHLGVDISSITKEQQSLLLAAHNYNPDKSQVFEYDLRVLMVKTDIAMGKHLVDPITNQVKTDTNGNLIANPNFDANKPWISNNQAKDLVRRGDLGMVESKIMEYILLDQVKPSLESLLNRKKRLSNTEKIYILKELGFIFNIDNVLNSNIDFTHITKNDINILIKIAPLITKKETDFIYILRYLRKNGNLNKVEDKESFFKDLNVLKDAGITLNINRIIHFSSFYHLNVIEGAMSYIGKHAEQFRDYSGVSDFISILYSIKEENRVEVLANYERVKSFRSASKLSLLDVENLSTDQLGKLFSLLGLLDSHNAIIEYTDTLNEIDCDEYMLTHKDQYKDILEEMGIEFNDHKDSDSFIEIKTKEDTEESLLEILNQLMQGKLKDLDLLKKKYEYILNQIQIKKIKISKSIEEKIEKIKAYFILSGLIFRYNTGNIDGLKNYYNRFIRGKVEASEHFERLRGINHLIQYPEQYELMRNSDFLMNLGPKRFLSLKEKYGDQVAKIHGYYDIYLLDKQNKTTIEKDQSTGSMSDEDFDRYFNKREGMFEQFSQLSKEEYLKLFSNKNGKEARIKQANVGNCYFVAALHSLRNSPHFEEIIRMSLRTVKGGREVKIPLCSKDGNRVQISLSDIGPQKIGRKEKLNPINALTGYQIIEAAFTKSHPRTYGEIDRKATNGGRMDEAIMLLLGNNHIISNKYGSTTEVAGETSKWIEIFENYNPGTDMLFLVGEPTSLKVTKKYNIISGWNRSESGYNHAYTIDNIDIINRTVIVVNPRDTSQKTKLTYDEIIKSFGNIQTVKTNYASLFANYL